ncbi:hypothetical protein FCH28_02860 [Streptomyces piniterrae]|uniref:Uncharacterized protein n=1 Tax=Streptomyces piniterrae TaxID=2571125 RepID=A0A4U0NWE7_9ACTN|nr:hypothetical protein [Streptomyces piniterrae]TJZ59091.1 hypothetical protein FCH28_02860 [Streptomyces piniterrae]
MTAPDPKPVAAPATATTDPFAPSTSAVRVFAGIGLLLLAFAFGAFLIIVLNQAYSGDGASGPLVGAAPWSMGLSAVAGLLALCLPSAVVSHAARRGAVRLQYALAFAGPALAAIDFA